MPLSKLQAQIAEEHWGHPARKGFANHFLIKCRDCGIQIGKCRCSVSDNKRIIVKELCMECKIKELEEAMR